MLIALSAMFGMLHAHRESFHDSKMELEHILLGRVGWSCSVSPCDKRGEASFRLRWLYKQAADCYSWLFIRDHKSGEIRAAKVPEKWMYVIMLSCGLDLWDRPTTPSLQSNRKSRKKCRVVDKQTLLERWSSSTLETFQKRSRILATEYFARTQNKRARGGN